MKRGWVNVSWRYSVADVVLLALMLAVPSSAFPHQDRAITLAADGRLVGLPAQYEPASLRIPAGSRDVPVVLQLGKNRLEFPECPSVLFAKAGRAHVRISASWYHDPKHLPYYLSIELPTIAPGAHGYYDGWSILVGLETARVLQVQAVFASKDGLSQREQGIDVKTFCGSGGETVVLSR